jgi:primosomal protein N'
MVTACSRLRKPAAAAEIPLTADFPLADLSDDLLEKRAQLTPQDNQVALFVKPRGYAAAD